VGALRVRNEAGLEFRVGTGLDDALRAGPPAVGERITYTYRGLTPGGAPRFASFLRVRPDA
jgi:DNA ligase-1